MDAQAGNSGAGEGVPCSQCCKADHSGLLLEYNSYLKHASGRWEAWVRELQSDNFSWPSFTASASILIHLMMTVESLCAAEVSSFSVLSSIFL